MFDPHTPDDPTPANEDQAEAWVKEMCMHASIWLRRLARLTRESNPEKLKEEFAKMYAENTDAMRADFFQRHFRRPDAAADAKPFPIRVALFYILVCTCVAAIILAHAAHVPEAQSLKQNEENHGKKMERVKSPQEEHREAMTIFTWLCLILLAGVVWVANRGLLLRLPQTIAIMAFLGLPIFYLIVVVRYCFELPQLLAKQWPRPRLCVSRTNARKSAQEAERQGVTFLGYENDGTPVYWTNDQRSMQANLPGQSGTGKTNLLLTIIDQDIRRGHPVVYFDGKGDKELVLKIWNLAFAAGRGADVRVIDPTHPDISEKYNPFYAADGKLQQRVGAVFDSIGAARAKDEFFSEHQRAFLNAVTVMLEHTGKQFTFWDVLVACQSRN